MGAAIAVYLVLGTACCLAGIIRPLLHRTHPSTPKETS